MLKNLLICVNNIENVEIYWTVPVRDTDLFLELNYHVLYLDLNNPLRFSH